MLRIAYCSLGIIIGDMDVEKTAFIALKNPRLINIKGDAGNGTVGFQTLKLFGDPSFIRLPGDTMLIDVLDKNITDSYRESVTGLILAGADNGHSVVPFNKPIVS